MLYFSDAVGYDLYDKKSGMFTLNAQFTEKKVSTTVSFGIAFSFLSETKTSIYIHFAGKIIK